MSVLRWLRNYRRAFSLAGELHEALQNLYDEFPKERLDHDWWPDSTRRAVKAAEALLQRLDGGAQ